MTFQNLDIVKQSEESGRYLVATRDIKKVGKVSTQHYISFNLISGVAGQCGDDGGGCGGGSSLHQD